MARHAATSPLARALKPYGVNLTIDGESHGIKIAIESNDWISATWATSDMARALRTLADTIDRVAKPYQDAQDKIDRASHEAYVASLAE